MADTLGLQDLFRRGNDGVKTREKKLPSELHQCVVFFSSPVLNELPVLGELNAIQNAISGIHKKLENSRFVFPYYSQEIFLSHEEAVRYLPTFISKLMVENKLPANAINPDRSTNDDVIQCAVIPLAPTYLETDIPEFKRN